jgi:hypothetical protein
MRPVRRADNLTTFMCRLSRNYGSLNLLEIGDLYLLYCYRWGRLNSTVHFTEVTDVLNLQQRIPNESEMIRTTVGIFEPVSQLPFRRATSSFKAQG